MSQERAQPVGTLATALDQAAKLLAAVPARAAEQALEILRVIPDQPGALLILGTARRRLGDAEGSLKPLDRLAVLAPAWGDAHYERGLTLAALGRAKLAQAALKRATELKPQLTDAWRALADQFT